MKNDRNMWLNENSQHLESEQLNAAHDWLAANYNDVVNPINIDSRWHYLDRKKKCGYIAEWRTSSDKNRYLCITFNDFKNPAINFNGYDTVNERWKLEKIRFTGDDTSYQQAVEQREAKAHEQAKRREAKAHEQAKRREAKAQKKFENVQRDLGLWQFLQPVREQSGVYHPYLVNKGVFPLGDVRRGHDNNGEFIALPIVDINGAMHGIQRIYSDGTKRFTWGLIKKNKFIAINELPPTNKRFNIIVTEGYATACSIAMLEPIAGAKIIAALDAGNLIHVIKDLRREYPRAKITIAADNDNTGLSAAHQAAIKYKCKVSAPTGLIKQDWNDYHQAHGLEATTQAFNTNITKPLPQWAFSKRNQNDYLDNERIKARGLFKGHILNTLNSRYLPKLEIKSGINLLRSPIGSGKTSLLKCELDKNPTDSTIYISHLVALVESAADKLGLDSYNEHDDKDLQILLKTAFCVNSLPRLVSKDGRCRNFHTVFIDEIEQLLKRLTTDIANKKMVMQVLTYLVQHADKVVLADAHIGNITMNWLKTINLNHHVYNVILNEWRNDDRVMTLTETRDHAIALIIRDLKAGKRVWLSVNSRNEAQRIKALINDKLKLNLLCIHGGNSGDTESLSFTSKPNEAYHKYDLVIASPAISTGLSIDAVGGKPVFDSVYGIFSSQGGNTPNDCIQALGRVREAKQITVFVDDTLRYFETNKEVISESWNQSHKFDAVFMGDFDSTGKQALEAGSYRELALNVEVDRNTQRTNFYSNFIKIASIDGYEILHLNGGNDLPKYSNEARKLEKLCYQRDVLNAVPIDKARRAEIANKNRVSSQEVAQATQYDIVEFYKIGHADLQQFIEIDRRGKMRTAITNLERALMPKATLQDFVEESRKDLKATKKFFDDWNHIPVKAVFHARLLDVAGLNVVNGQLTVRENYTFNKSSDDVIHFIQWVEQNRLALNGAELQIPNSIKSPVTFIRERLKQLANISLANEGAVRRYSLDVESLQRVNKIIAARGTKLVDGKPCQAVNL